MGEIKGSGLSVATIGGETADGRQRWRVSGAGKAIGFYADRHADHLVVLRLAAAALIEQGDGHVDPFDRR